MPPSLAVPPICSRASNRTALADNPLDSHHSGTSPIPSNSVLFPSHPMSFENMLRQFRKLPVPSQTINYPLWHLESPHCLPRSANSQPPSPLTGMGAPFGPVSCHMSTDQDAGIPTYHRFHNDSHLNLSPTSSGSSEGLSCFADEFPASWSLFDKFRNTRSRILHVGTSVLYTFQRLISLVLKLQKDHRWPLSSFVSFLTEVSAPAVERSSC